MEANLLIVIVRTVRSIDKPEYFQKFVEEGDRGGRFHGLVS
jgi:hypothetical protein